MRGDYRYWTRPLLYCLGSPPHSWGLQDRHRPHLLLDGITPTCVGTTNSRWTSRLSRRDHPHMRGDYPIASEAVPCVPGSPPHAWGLHGQGHRPRVHAGITPTCVGTTRTSGRPGPCGRDHPHMRGDYGFLALCVLAAPGSPPHAWGLHRRGDRCGGQDGITPTCVGTTSS